MNLLNLYNPRELDYRESDGISVSLLWYADLDTVSVRVVDGQTEEEFEVEVAADDALDAFRHPYAYILARAA
jgi:hypothetical protein